jgi:hypothetical protein
MASAVLLVALLKQASSWLSFSSLPKLLMLTASKKYCHHGMSRSLVMIQNLKLTMVSSSVLLQKCLNAGTSLASYFLYRDTNRYQYGFIASLAFVKYTLAIFAI